MLALLGLWLAFVIYISRKLSSFIPGKYLPKVIAVLLFLLILPLPVADEIIAKPQFDKLCKEAELKIDTEEIKGKTVRLVIEPSNQYISGTAIPIRYSHYSLKDFYTGKEYAQLDHVAAKGGWLVHLLGTSETREPLIFAKSSCSGADITKSFTGKYNFKLVDGNGNPAK